LPPELDVAVRVDVSSLRGDLGAELAQRLLLDALGRGGDAGPSTLLAQALTRSQLLWLGLSARDDVDSSERVLILRGHFAEVPIGAEPASSEWVASEGDGDLESFSRATPALGAYARLYAPPGREHLIWATSAQEAAVERTLRRGSAHASLRPPERGELSLSARSDRLRDQYAGRFPELVTRFDGARLLEAYVETHPMEWRAEVTLSFENEAQALDAGQVVEQLQQALGKNACALGIVARAARVSTFQSKLRVSARLVQDQLAAAKSCLLTEKCCA
jgi:hypothetical protein